MHDLNNRLSNQATTWRTQAAGLLLEAEAADARAAAAGKVAVVKFGDQGRQAGAMTADVELSKPHRAEAEAKRLEASWLVDRAEAADRGAFLIDPADYRKLDPGQSPESRLKADYLAAGRKLEVRTAEVRRPEGVSVTSFFGLGGA